MKQKISFMCLQLLLILFSALMVSAQSSVNIYPPSQTIRVGETATVVVNVTDITNLYGFQFSLAYNPVYIIYNSSRYLGLIGYYNPDNPSDPSNEVFLTEPDTNTAGIIKNYGCTRLGSWSGFTGSGDLVTINFTTPLIDPQNGTSIITLNDVKLSDNVSQNIGPDSTTGGQINVVWCFPGDRKSCVTTSHNDSGACEYGYYECVNGDWGTVCIDEVSPSIEYCDYGLFLSDEADNNCDGVIDNVERCKCAGGVSPDPSETCNNIDDNCNNQTDEGIAPRSCAEITGNTHGRCAQGTAECVNGEWKVNQSGMLFDCWTPVADETIEPWCNNSMNDDCDADEWDNVCGGDVNRDFCVDFDDLQIIAYDFGLVSGYTEESDLTRDGQVDIFDLVIVGSDYGSSYYGHTCQ